MALYGVTATGSFVELIWSVLDALSVQLIFKPLFVFSESKAAGPGTAGAGGYA